MNFIQLTMIDEDGENLEITSVGHLCTQVNFYLLQSPLEYCLIQSLERDRRSLDVLYRHTLDLPAFCLLDF